MLDFVVSLVDKMDIGVYDYKVGMLIFSRSYRSVFYLSKYDNKNDTIAAIKSTRHNILNRVVTDTGDALNYARRSMASTSYGRRHGAKLVVVTLVSSPSSSPSATVANAKALKDSTGATMLSIGVGSRVPDSDLAALASDPTLINRVAGFDDLPSAEMNVMLEICPNNWHTVSPQTANLTVSDCPAGLPRDQYLKVFQGMCYQFFTNDLRSYYAAEKKCEEFGGTLVMPKTSDIDFFVFTTMRYVFKKEAAVWIGLREVNGEENYVWVDGEPANYTNFGRIVGHDTRENCIALYTGAGDASTWKEYGCSDSGWMTSFRFVCQYTPPSLVTTQAPTTQNPTTQTPTTQNPTTQNPITQNPTTQNLITQTPTTQNPITQNPTTQTPTTQAPTTVAPTTVAPTTVAPTTIAPTTVAPTTVAPTTVAPTTVAPTTVAPTTLDLTTVTPTTQTPTTQAPSTVAPTTLAPTTVTPTTLAPTTVTPSTPGPTSQSTPGFLQCPPFVCDLDCGLDGYKVDANQCSICLCDAS